MGIIFSNTLNSFCGNITIQLGKVCLAIDSTLDRMVSFIPYSAIHDSSIGNSNVIVLHVDTHISSLFVFFFVCKIKPNMFSWF